MKSRKLLIGLVCLIAFLVVGYFVWPYAFTVVPIAEVEQKKLDEAFDPVKYVDSLWDSKIIPTINTKAVNLAEILTAMQPNAQGTAAKDDLVKVANQFGLVTVNFAHVYLVKGEGKVVLNALPRPAWA